MPLCVVTDLVSLPKLFTGLVESIPLPLLLLFPRKQQSQSSCGAEGALPLSPDVYPHSKDLETFLFWSFNSCLINSSVF